MTHSEHDRVFGALGLALRAGKLKCGFDQSEKAVLRGADMGLVARDASERTRRKFTELCEESGTPLTELPVTADELDERVGKRFAVAAVTDENLGALITKAIEEGDL